MTTQAALVTGTDFVAVPTKDYEAAAGFYGEVLGLPFGKRWGEMPAGEFEAGNLTIAIMQSDAFGIEFHPHGHPIALHVEDVEAARAELESRGVAFAADTMDSGVCHMAVFADPDGNALMLHHRYAPKDEGPGAGSPSGRSLTSRRPPALHEGRRDAGYPCPQRGRQAPATHSKGL